MPVPPRHDARILVVDDEPEMLDFLARVLERHGHEVDTASGAAAARELVRERDYDVVLTDLRLGCRDSGLDLLQQVKASSPGTEVVVVSGYSSVERAVAALRLGAGDFIEKPLNAERLVTSIDAALEHRRVRLATNLFQTCQAIFATKEPERLPQVVVEVAMKVMEADDASLMLPDEQGRLAVVHSHTLGERIRASARRQLGEGIAGRVAEDGRPVVLPHSLAGDPRFSGQGAGRVRSSIVYPLHSGERLVGVLNLNRVEARRPFREADLERASVLAAQAVLALENARLVRELRARIDELERTHALLVHSERLAAIGQLAAGIAHEINGPMAYLVGNLEAVREAVQELRQVAPLLDSAPFNHLVGDWAGRNGATELTEDLLQALDDAHEGATRIRDLISELRILSRTDWGEKTRCDIAEIVASAVRVAGPSLGPDVAVDVDIEKGLWVVGNARRLSQVFVNLLVNAAQAIHEAPDPREPTISIRARAEGGLARSEVADNGPGLPPELLERVFEPFFTTKEASRGTGLGLSICREIAHRYGGEISVEIPPEGGTRFVLELPLDIADPAE